MQSDVPPLPISCLTDNLRLHRTSFFKAKPAVHINKVTSVPRRKIYNSQPLLQRKILRPAVAAGPSPYKNSARVKPKETAKPTNKSVINQRVSSANMQRIKILQNQLADAHYHLNELSRENKLLKEIQRRQDSALKRYEGTNAELPRIINTHHEDLRVLQTKYKKLKSQYNNASETLKEKDNELHSLQAQNKKLLQLSKDRHLGERDKLQTQVFDLTHRINEQDDTIQTLRRKLELETKYLKHQLHVEMVKHKETRKELEDAQAKLQYMERLSEQRLKRSYLSSQLTYYSKGPTSVTSQSLTNLSDNQSETPFKLHSFRKLQSEGTTNQSLPSLNGALSTPNRSQDNLRRLNFDTSPKVTERTIKSPEKSRNVRLQNSPASHRASSLSTSKSTANDSPIKESVLDEADPTKSQDKLDVNFEKPTKTYELPMALRREFDYLTDEEKSSKGSRSNSNDSLNDNLNYASRSRSLHARLVNSATEGVRTNKTTISSRSRSLTKENLDNIMENEKEVKYDRDSVITVIHKEIPVKGDVDTNTNGSNSDIESEMDIPVAYAADEDDNVRRKSDVIIEEVEVHRQKSTASPLSSLFTHLRKPPNYSFGSNKNEEKIESSSINKKEINGFTIPNKNLTDIVDDEPAEQIAARQTSVTKSITETSWDEDLFGEDKNKQESNQSSSSDSNEVTKDQENDITTSAEKLLDDIAENLKETKKLENNVINKSSSNNILQNKSSHANFKKSDVKNVAENKTVNENTKSFDKAKLLAAMKAIDDNDNVEFVDQKPRKNSASNRLRITENLYRGLPTHKKKSELMKELFADSSLDSNKNDN